MASLLGMQADRHMADHGMAITMLQQHDVIISRCHRHAMLVKLTGEASCQRAPGNVCIQDTVLDPECHVKQCTYAALSWYDIVRQGGAQLAVAWH